MRVIVTFWILILGGFQIGFAQTASTQTILSTAGDYIKSEQGTSLSWTIGEVFSQTVTGQQHLTEGFQQGNILKQPTLIVDFTAERTSNSTVELDWGTKGQLGNNGFIVQRRLESEQDFSTIAFVNSEETNENTTYQLEDENEFLEKSYYRIQYTFGSKNQWSAVQAIEGIQVIQQIAAFPNPTTDYITIAVESNLPEQIKTIDFNIFDITGKQVLPMQSFQFDNEQIRIDAVQGLKAGNYIIQPIINGQSCKSIQFIKLSK